MTAETSNARGEWVLVPREPTEAMLDAMHSRIRILCDPAARTADIQNDREVWAAMLAVSPPAPISVPLDRLTALDGLVDRIAEAIRDGAGLAEGDPPWERLGEERRAPWRADARRALSVVKESLTAAGILAARTSQPPDAEVRALPAKWRDRAANNPGSFAAAANVVCADDLEAALAAEGVRAGEVAAWETEDGRVISARQKATALRDGGASASSVAPYTTPLYRTAPPSAPVGVEWPLSLLRAGHWREVYIGHRCMQLEVTYDYATWERLMAEVESALAQQPAAVDEADTLLCDLVEALDAAFISSWQSTAAWQKQLDAAREYLAAQRQEPTT